jgi:hypothetical protein
VKPKSTACATDFAREFGASFVARLTSLSRPLGVPATRMDEIKEVRANFLRAR